MSISSLTQKRAAGIAGAVAAAAIEAGLSPATALLGRMADLAMSAAALPRPAALTLAMGAIAGISLGAEAYARPLSRKAAFASGFCAVAVLALLAP